MAGSEEVVLQLVVGLGGLVLQLVVGLGGLVLQQVVGWGGLLPQQVVLLLVPMLPDGLKGHSGRVWQHAVLKYTCKKAFHTGFCNNELASKNDLHLQNNVHCYSNVLNLLVTHNQILLPYL